MSIIPKVKGYAVKILLLCVASVCVLLYRLCFFLINYTVFLMKITVRIHLHIYSSCSPALSVQMPVLNLADLKHFLQQPSPLRQP